jgi:hypothetical protein
MLTVTRSLEMILELVWCSLLLIVALPDGKYFKVMRGPGESTCIFLISSLFQCAL